MKKCFKSKRFTTETWDIIHTANDIIEQYQAMGYVLTLRQLYYQFIGRDLFPASWIDPGYNQKEGLAPDTKNTVKNYKRLGGIIGDARMAGHIDWDAIEDRARQMHRHPHWSGPDTLVESALASYRRDRWANQDVYVELWCEKDALSGVLEPVADEFHVPFMANRGYSSLSAMYESAQRFQRACGPLRRSVPEGKRIPKRVGVIFYLGDHDPSGEDMVRDVRDRMLTFLEWDVLRDQNGEEVSPLVVRKVALTYEQIQQYELPPNPAKLSDSRAKAYVEKFGDDSWELDALEPDVLADMARKEIVDVLDENKMNTIREEEDADKVRLREVLAQLR